VGFYGQDLSPFTSFTYRPDANAAIGACTANCRFPGPSEKRPKATVMEPHGLAVPRANRHSFMSPYPCFSCVVKNAPYACLSFGHGISVFPLAQDAVSASTVGALYDKRSALMSFVKLNPTRRPRQDAPGSSTTDHHPIRMNIHTE